MKKIIVLVSVLFAAGCASLPSHYISLDHHTAESLDAVLKKIEKERVIFIGEIHGTTSIHLLQLEIIKYLHQRGKQVAVALEAFPSSKQSIFDRWVERKLGEDDFERTYKETWSVPYEYYRGILMYAREKNIPLIAINADNAMIAAVSKYGLHQASEDFLREVKFTDCSADSQYKEIVGKTYHAAEFPFLCDGQRLRDSVMAYNIAHAMRGNKVTVVVLAGATHAMKIAVPRMLQSHDAVSYVVLMPATITRILRRPPDLDIADVIWK